MSSGNCFSPGPGHRPDPARGRRHSRAKGLTAGDRSICAICGALIGATIWTIVYFFMIIGVAGPQKHAGTGMVPTDPFDRLPAYGPWVAVTAAGFALLGAVGGPDRLVDFAAWVMKSRRRSWWIWWD